MGGRGSKGKPRRRPEDEDPAPLLPPPAEQVTSERDRIPEIDSGDGMKDRHAQVRAQVIAGIRWLLPGDPDDRGNSGRFVSITELRRLTGLPREEFDAALKSMYRAQQVNLIPQSSPRALTAEDRDAAVYIGAENKHLISIVTERHQGPQG
jgi:hypothetical protein